MTGARVSPTNIISGTPDILNYLSRMFPPSTSMLAKIGRPLIETFQIAISAIILSTIIALPMSFLAAKNVMPVGAVYRTTKAVLGVLRGIPPLLFGLLLVAMVGLGPFAGTLALTLHCIGTLGRYFAEAVENIDPDKINAAKAVGANKIKTIIYAIIPEVRILFLGYILYYFEYNVRSSTVLGMVGAGGIGSYLVMAIHLFRYGDVAMLMLIIIGIIVLMEIFSTQVRGRLIGGSS